MKKTKMIAAAVMIALAMIAAGCAGTGEAEMTMDASDEKNVEITLNNAAKDDFVTAGTLVVGDGEELIVESELKKGGKVSIELIVISEEEQSAEELPLDLSDGNIGIGSASYEMTAEGSGSMSYTVDPGEYYISVTVLDKATGTVSLIAK